MQVHKFIADSAADAVAQIRAQLGPQALVLDVRPMARDGLSRLWGKPRIEVLACVPEEAPSTSLPSSPLEPSLLLTELPSPPVEPPAQPVQPPAPTAEMSAPNAAGLRREPLDLRQNVAKASPSAPVRSAREPLPHPPPRKAAVHDIGRAKPVSRPGGAVEGWRVGSFLENSGLMPLYVERILDELRTSHGEAPPPAFRDELELTQNLLQGHWKKRQPKVALEEGTHVLVGPPGVGKTVSLCKWLAQMVLLEERPAEVWRLDGRVANTAELLSVYTEILGITIERCLPAAIPSNLPGLLLVDLPGVNSADRDGLRHLAGQIQQLPQPHVHLVLNAAYELPLLLAQARAFSSLPLVDLIFTHLDEEPRWGKLWNFVLGTNFTIRMLSAGQNIPGDWFEATPDRIFSRQFPAK